MERLPTKAKGAMGVTQVFTSLVERAQFPREGFNVAAGEHLKTMNLREGLALEMHKLGRRVVLASQMRRMA